MNLTKWAASLQDPKDWVGKRHLNVKISNKKKGGIKTSHNKGYISFPRVKKAI
jgi:hypothetical protein